MGHIFGTFRLRERTPKVFFSGEKYSLRLLPSIFALIEVNGGNLRSGTIAFTDTVAFSHVSFCKSYGSARHRLISGDVVDAMNKGLQELSPEYVHRVNMNIIHKVPENITMPADCVPLNRVTQHKIDPATKRTINNYPCAEKLKTCL